MQLLFQVFNTKPALNIQFFNLYDTPDFICTESNHPARSHDQRALRRGLSAPAAATPELTMAAREWYLDDLRREIAALRKLQRDGDANLVRTTARQALIVPTLPNVRKCCQILASSIRFTNSTSFITSPLAKSQ